MLKVVQIRQAEVGEAEVCFYNGHVENWQKIEGAFTVQELTRLRKAAYESLGGTVQGFDVLVSHERFEQFEFSRIQQKLALSSALNLVQ